MTDEYAKAVQEAAKTTGKALEVAEKVGGSKVGQALDATAAEIVGIGKDYFQHARFRIRARLAQRTMKLLNQRGVEAPTLDDLTPALLIPIVQPAQDEGRKELLELWARLLAAALDPERRNQVRKSFIEAVKQMDPPDALVLSKFYELPPDLISRDGPSALAGELHLSVDEVSVSLTNLRRLDYVDIAMTGRTAAGRELLRVLT